jgi:hypothetical protein
MDPRISCWYEIADAFEEEINFRSGESPKSKAEHPNAQNNASTPQTAENRAAKAAASRFTHSPDYRSVTIDGLSFTLTFKQAQLVQILHEALESGTPDLGIHYILERLETPNARWQDTFKGNADAKKALIAYGSRKGTLRLNL